MDTVTHTLFGLALYGAVNKKRMTKNERRALLCCTLIGSQIPDIDVVSSLWDANGRYQMWHRGITHSLFLVPLWAWLIAYPVRLFFKVDGRFWFWITALAVLIHNTADIFNAWGTGYFEPFSAVRLTFGTTPIVDLVFWVIILLAFLIVRFSPQKGAPHRIYRWAWVLIALQVISQGVQGAILYEQTRHDYDRVTLVADFVPTQFVVVAQKGAVVELLAGDVWQGLAVRERLYSDVDADKETLFRNNPRARTLVEWSPIVVWRDDGTRIAVFDPRFYRNGESFLTEEWLRND
jgi:inner membrane protein